MNQNRTDISKLSTDQIVKMINDRFAAELPEPLYTETKMEEAWIELSDGVKLFAYVCMPAAEGSWPVILVRNPYQANEQSDLIMAGLQGKPFAEQGYAFVYSRVRGTGRSQGEFDPFVNERRDGIDVIDWISKQSWCNGKIGTFGGSYLGHVQWCVAGSGHPALKTSFISVYGINAYHLFYRRGMFRQDIWTEWAAQMMGDNRHGGEHVAEAAKRGFDVFPQIELGKQLIGEDCQWYNEWVTNTAETDPYWSEGFWSDLYESFKDIRIPLFLHGGWFDVFIRSQLESWRALPKETREKSRFEIGPWHHGGTPSGDLTYPGESRTGLFQIKEALEWFDFQLKGKPYPHRLGVIEAYSIGDNKWRIWEDDIVPGSQSIFYLGSDNTLSAGNPGENGKNNFLYDPNNPTKSLSIGLAKGSVYYPEPGTREGVISFVSEPLTDELHIAGQIKAKLYVSSSAPATSFALTVLEMFEDGKSVNIVDDITDIRWRDENERANYEPGSIIELSLHMTDISWMLKKGSRLRIDISSSNYPLYHVHPNTDENWACSTKRVTAEQTVYYGKDYPSMITLPVNLE